MDSAWTWGASRVVRHVAERLGVRPVGTATRLTDGLLNVVWRVPVAGPGAASVIVKCVPPFVASAPDVPLAPSRMAAEARALNALGPRGMLAGVAADPVHVPRLLDVDADRSVLVIEDVGDLPDLVTWLDAAPPHAALDPGRVLGGFVGRLHATTLGRPDLASFFNPDVQATRLVVQYRAVGRWLAEAGVADADALGAVALAMGERFTHPGRCVVMGDLWPRSVLVAPDGRLNVIDWELSTLGEPAQDLGHLAAHLWMRDRLDVWDAFVGGYRQAAGAALPRLLAEETAADAACHAACEVLARTAGMFHDAAVDRSDAVSQAVRWLRSPGTALLAEAHGGAASPSRGRLLEEPARQPL